MGMGGGSKDSAAEMVKDIANPLAWMVGGNLGAASAPATTPAAEQTTQLGPLPHSLFYYIARALESNSPWEHVTAINPDLIIKDVLEGFQDYEDVLGTLKPTTGNNWQSTLTEVVTQVDNVINEAFIDAAVDSFEIASEANHASRVNAVMGGLYAANAAEGSVLPMAMAMLVRGRGAELSEYRARLAGQLELAKINFIQENTRMLVEDYQRFLANKKDQLLLAMDIARLELVAKREELADQVEYAYRHATWDMGLFSFGGSLLAAAAGAQTIPLGPAKSNMSLAGMTMGASAGAAIGGAVGQGHPLMGAAIGGLGGFFAGQE